MAQRRALQTVLVERGLCDSREQALAVIDAGEVLVAGVIASNPQRQVSSSEAVTLLGPSLRFVSRGGKKLDAAIVSFAIPMAGRSAIDAGSATGGFTDVLLRHGAQWVLSVDVGYGQLHETLRADQRVTSLERTNIRDLTCEQIESYRGERDYPTLLVADLSFTRTATHLDHFRDLLRHRGELVLLCKPQFEVDPDLAAKRAGVILDNEERKQAVMSLSQALADRSMGIKGVIASPILGPKGNAEFLLHVSLESSAHAIDIEVQVTTAIETAGAIS